MLHHVVRRNWENDLRYTSDPQVHQKLRDADNGRCCLGRLCDVAGFAWDGLFIVGLGGGTSEQYKIPYVHLEMLGLSDQAQDRAAGLNDADKLTFPQIADFVRFGYFPKVPDRDEYDRYGKYIGGQFVEDDFWSGRDDKGIKWVEI